MIAAIVIPILFIFFYFTVKRNNAAYEKRWRNVGDINEQLTLSGTLERSFVEKKRFYHHRYIWNFQIYLKDKHELIKVIYEKPALTDIPPLKLTTHDKIKCYGQWNGKNFLANRIVTE